MSLLSIEEVINLQDKEVKEMHKKYLNPGLVSIMGLINFDRVYTSALGSVVEDREGNEYVDFLGGYGSLNVGHNHPKVLQAIEKVKNYPNILQASLGIFSAALAKNLAQVAPGELNRSFFCNSGAEAVEGALKLARAASKKEKIIFCEGSFHGKTLGALSVTGREKYQKLFKPLLAGCEQVNFGDSQDLERKLKKNNAAAFIMECIQGEGGIIVPPEGYLRDVRELCSKYETLLIVDEIQTGLGRTGKMFACQHEGIQPDIMCLAKSLGGGISPLGAYMTTEKIYNKAYGGMENSLLHTSTFGGNTFASAAGIAALQIIVSEKLPQQAWDKGVYLISKLKALKDKYSIIKDIRGRGLMIGLELQGSSNSILNRITGGRVDDLAYEYFASMVAGKLLNEYNIITAYTLNNPNVIRIEPPLNIEYKYLDKLVFALEDIFQKNQSFLKLALANIKNIF